MKVQVPAIAFAFIALLTSDRALGEEDLCMKLKKAFMGPKALDDPASIDLRHVNGTPSTWSFKANFDSRPTEVLFWAETTRPGIQGNLDIGQGVHVECSSRNEHQAPTNLVYVKNDGTGSNVTIKDSAWNTSLTIEGRWMATETQEDGSLIVSAMWRHDELWHWTQSTPVHIRGVDFWTRKAMLGSHKSAAMKQYEVPPLKGSRKTLAVGDLTYDSFYDACEVKQGCVGCTAAGACTGKAGQGCIGSRNCAVIVNYSWLGTKVTFQLLGRQVPLSTSSYGWVAMGISKDANMGGDSVVLCKTARGRDGLNISIDAYWNSGKTAPNLLDPSPTGVVLDARGRYENGDLFCTFSQRVETTVESNKFDLYRETYYVLLAMGPIRTDGSLAMHTVRGAPGSAVNLTSVEGADPSAEALELSHGIIMIFAWMAAASSGILTARYYKRTWVSSKIMGKAAWFQVHRFFMGMTWLLTIIGFALIMIKEKEIERHYHPLIGMLVLILTFAQPFLALARCNPNTQNRLWFNWAHWLIGSVAHILAFVNIFLAMDFSRVSEKGYYIFGAFVLFYCIINLLLSCQGYMGEAHERNSTSPLVEDKSEYDLLAAKEGHGSGLRKFFFALIIIINWGAAIVMACVFAGLLGGEVDDDWTKGA